MRSAIKSIPLVRELVSITRKFFGVTPEILNERFHKKRSKQLIESYLSSTQIRKIQIGAQSNPIKGWMNLDLLPKSVAIVYMDATKPFEFPENSIDYIFTEHMLEHISLQDALFMMKECFRVLKPKGKIRISTPNLAFLVSLFNEEKDETQKKYIEFSINRYLKNNVPQEDVYVINNFFRDWGHQFIHDYKSLYYILSSAGFSFINQCNVNESVDVNLQNLEQHGKEISNDFNKLESIVVEATKI